MWGGERREQPLSGRGGLGYSITSSKLQTTMAENTKHFLVTFAESNGAISGRSIRRPFLRCNLFVLTLVIRGINIQVGRSTGIKSLFNAVNTSMKRLEVDVPSSGKRSRSLPYRTLYMITCTRIAFAGIDRKMWLTSVDVPHVTFSLHVTFLQSDRRLTLAA